MDGGFEYLPDEVVEEIFSYCTYDDLVLSFQFVSEQWERVFHRTSLWRKITYIAKSSEKNEDIIKKLEMSPKLHYLDLARVECEDSVFQALLQNCSQLRKLQLSSDQNIHSHTLELIVTKCPKIEELHLSEWILHKEEKAKVIGRFPQLRKLTVIRYGKFSCYIFLLPLAAGCPSLEILNIHSEEFAVGELNILLEAKTQQLHTLSICCYNDWNVDDCPLLSLSACKSLNCLTIYGSCDVSREIKDQSIQQLSNLRSLTWLAEDTGCEYITGVFEGTCMWTQIQELRLDVTPYNTDSLLSFIIKKCPHLKILGFRRTDLMTDVGFIELLKLRNLQYLYINTKTALLPVSHTMKCTVSGRLKFLRIDHSECLTTKSMEVLGASSNLEVLQLYDCDVENLPFDIIPRCLSHLKKMVLDCCHSVDEIVLEDLKKDMPDLKIVLNAK